MPEVPADSVLNVMENLNKIRSLVTEVEKALNPVTAPVKYTEHDDNHTAIVYSAGWSTSTGDVKFGGGDHHTASPGAMVTIKFNGTGIRLSGAAASHHGSAVVSLDAKAGTVTQRAETRVESQVFYNATNLAPGDHTLTVTVVGDGVVAIDKVEVLGTLIAPPVTQPPNPPTNLIGISRKGNKLYRGAEPWWFVGYNSFVWSGNCGNPNEKMSAAQVEAWFASMRHDGHGLVRLFFFAGWDYARLDAALASAKKHGIYLIITLDDAIAGCGESKKDSGWFTNGGERTTFRDHLTRVLTKYKGEPQILALEYFNEPGGGSTAQALRSFYDEMGKIRDSIDPTRLMMSGTVAPYWVGGEAQFKLIHESSGIDIASMHEYDQDEAASNHTGRCIANSAGKPLIVGEFGIYSSETGQNCKTNYAERAKRFERKVKAYLNTEGCSGALAWAWQPGGNAGTCGYGTLDRDQATQKVLREASK